MMRGVDGVSVRWWECVFVLLRHVNGLVRKETLNRGQKSISVGQLIRKNVIKRLQGNAMIQTGDETGETETQAVH